MGFSAARRLRGLSSTFDAAETPTVGISAAPNSQQHWVMGVSVARKGPSNMQGFEPCSEDERGSSKKKSPHQARAFRRVLDVVTIEC